MRIKPWSTLFSFHCEPYWQGNEVYPQMKSPSWTLNLQLLLSPFVFHCLPILSPHDAMEGESSSHQTSSLLLRAGSRLPPPQLLIHVGGDHQLSISPPSPLSHQTGSRSHRPEATACAIHVATLPKVHSGWREDSLARNFKILICQIKPVSLEPSKYAPRDRPEESDSSSIYGSPAPPSRL